MYYFHLLIGRLLHFAETVLLRHGTQPRTISRIDMTVDDVADVIDPKEEQREEGER
jgi:hypothetical protein